MGKKILLGQDWTQYINTLLIKVCSYICALFSHIFLCYFRHFLQRSFLHFWVQISKRYGWSLSMIHRWCSSAILNYGFELVFLLSTGAAKKKNWMRHVPFFMWPPMLVVGNMTLSTCCGSEERNFFQLPHPIKQLSLFSNGCMFIFFAPSITWAAFQYVTYF